MFVRSSVQAALLGLIFVASGASVVAQDEMLDWHDDYASALAEAQRTGKPIFLEFRCAP